MPNERIGILFGQLQCIDCISYHSSPRRNLEAKGEDINEEAWGDIVMDGYVDDDNKLHSLSRCRRDIVDGHGGELDRAGLWYT
jgi:hypothetical protein